MQKHTPGPYVLTQWDNFPDQQVITDETGTRCLALIDKNDEQDEANAILFTASPKLADALEAARKAIEHATDIMHYEDGQPVTALEGHEIEDAYGTLVSVLVQIEEAQTAQGA